MKASTLARLGWKHTKNHLAEITYLKTGYDLTRPVTFYGLVNERCNVKCRFCEYWRLDKYQDEMSIEEWQTALLSIKEFVGEYSINFSGGEPLIKPGFIDLMVWCNKQGIHSGVTTNGSPLTRKNAKRIAEAKPFNINISCDAPNAELHDYLRGSPGLFEKLSNGVKYLRDERDAAGLDFPIIIKSTINSKNFRLLPDIVEWAKEVGATAVNFQPMDRWTQETYNELWIEEEEHSDLQEVINTLIKMITEGAPILNSKFILELTTPHFLEEKAPPESLPCLVGMRNFFIRTNGDIELCFYYPVIGNIKKQSAKEIWCGEKTQEVRKKTVECDRLCLYTCLSQKKLKDKIKMGLKLFRV
jgi:MoaA/NifB/PqqE/SkfB family radical SAM enzyme